MNMNNNSQNKSQSKSQNKFKNEIMSIPILKAKQAGINILVNYLSSICNAQAYHITSTPIKSTK